jgi:hypothetical protein
LRDSQRGEDEEMLRDLTSGVGFACKSPAPAQRRSVTFVELIATLALAMSTVIAATAVSIGMARAADLSGVVDGDSPIATALVFGILLAGMGGLTALIAGERRRRRS